MELEILNKEKYYAYTSYRVYSGRYTGEPIASTKDKRHWIIRDLPLCQMNVASFSVKDRKTYFRLGVAYTDAIVQIVWRDSTESMIVIPASAVNYIAKAIKRDRAPYQTLL